MTTPVYGENPVYDTKVIYALIHLHTTFTVTDVKTQLQKVIDTDRDMVHNMGTMMDASCVAGYKWSTTMLEVVSYHTVLKDNCQSVLDANFTKNADGLYLEDSFMH